jgi:putative protease
VVAPLNSHIDIVDNEIGLTYERDGKIYIKLKQLLAKDKKIWKEVHSGNINPIKLPTKLPSYTFLRIPANLDMGTYPKS